MFTCRCWGHQCGVNVGSWRAEASSGLARWRNLLLRAAHPAKHRRIEHALRLLDIREEGECSFVAQRGCGCQFETADQMACECQRCYGMDVPAAQSGPLNWTFIDSSPHTSLLLFTVSTVYYSNTLKTPSGIYYYTVLTTCEHSLGVTGSPSPRQSQVRP